MKACCGKRLCILSITFSMCVSVRLWCALSGTQVHSCVWACVHVLACTLHVWQRHLSWCVLRFVCWWLQSGCQCEVAQVLWGNPKKVNAEHERCRLDALHLDQTPWPSKCWRSVASDSHKHTVHYMQTRQLSIVTLHASLPEVIITAYILKMLSSWWNKNQYRTCCMHAYIQIH